MMCIFVSTSTCPHAVGPAAHKVRGVRQTSTCNLKNRRSGLDYVILLPQGVLITVDYGGRRGG